jgi:hypothetical protein
MSATNTEEELAALRAEVAELRRQLEEVRSAFRFHDGKLVELCMRDARVENLTFGPTENLEASYGWIHTGEAGTIMCLANGGDHAGFMLRTGKHAEDDGVKIQVRNEDRKLILKPDAVAVNRVQEMDHQRKVSAEAGLGISKEGHAYAAIFGEGKQALAALRATPEGGVVQCKSPQGAGVFIHVREDAPLVTLHDAQNRNLVQIGSTTTGGIVMIHGGESCKPVAILGAGDDGSMVELRSFDQESRVSLQAREKTSDLFVRRPGKTNDGLFLRSNAEGATLDLVHEGKGLAHLGYRWIGMDMILSPELGGGKISSEPLAYGGALHLTTTDNRMLTFSPVDVQSQIASLSPEGLMQFQMGAPFDAGGRLVLYNEVGVERLCFLTQKDSAIIQLQHGGTPGITLAATPEGGGVCTLNPQGEVTGTMPEEFDHGFGKGDGEEAR